MPWHRYFLQVAKTRAERSLEKIPLFLGDFFDIITLVIPNWLGITKVNIPIHDKKFSTPRCGKLFFVERML